MSFDRIFRRDETVSTGLRQQGVYAHLLGSRSPNGWMRVGGLFAVILAAFVFLPASTATAQQAEMHDVTWAHGNPDTVSRFVVFVSPVEGSVGQARQVDVGKPTGTLSGALHFYTAMVSAGEDEFVAVAALDAAGRMSTLSAWSGMPPSQPGQPLLIGP